MADRSAFIAAIHDLIDTCRDGEKGWQDAANHAKRSDLKTWFHEVSQERSGFARELQMELTRMAPDENKESQGHLVGDLHRAWIDTKTALGAGDHEILAWLEQGEDFAKRKYETALSQGLPAGVLSIVRQQAQSVRSVHDRVKAMRDQKAA
ncbi:MAG TPA: PA2169 family four-helix-bundle protein [Terriglobales bacterium]|nr:PA2169 family four-helix-bundle protein [Terriglobales bacterium]